MPGAERLRHARLPETADLAPYLARIDDHRIYSNFGPLSRELEQRLAALTGALADTVVVTASGTSALIAALIEVCPEPGHLCILPAFTFPAAPAAVQCAGLIPYFADVRDDEGVLDAEQVEALIASLGSRVGAIMPVSPFGLPLDTEAWAALQARTGVPVVTDAAWCIDSLSPSGVVQAVSLHATKALGLGEGGVVLAAGQEQAQRIRQRLNFGFSPDRHTVLRGFNGKLSEHVAAVGLAALDQWPETRHRLQEVQSWYLQRIEAMAGVRPLHRPGEAWVSGVFAVVLDRPSGSRLVDALHAEGIDARCWWHPVCPDQPAFAVHAASAIERSRVVAKRVVNLPLHTELQERDVARIAGHVDAHLRASSDYSRDAAA